MGVSGFPCAKVADTAAFGASETFLDTVLDLWNIEPTDVDVMCFYRKLDHGEQAVLMSEDYSRGVIRC